MNSVGRWLTRIGVFAVATAGFVSPGHAQRGDDDSATMPEATTPIVRSTAPNGDGDNRAWVGLRVGYFFPSDGEIRSAMGSSMFSIGLGQSSRRLPAGVSYAIDWNILWQNRNGNHFFQLTPSYGIVYTLAEEDATTRPYVAARLGVSYTDYAITRTSTAVRYDGRRFGLNANLEAGVNIGDRWNVALRYDLGSRHDVFRFDGFTFSVTYGFVRF